MINCKLFWNSRTGSAQKSINISYVLYEICLKSSFEHYSFDDFFVLSSYFFGVLIHEREHWHVNYMDVTWTENNRSIRHIQLLNAGFDIIYCIAYFFFPLLDIESHLDLEPQAEGTCVCAEKFCCLCLLPRLDLWCPEGLWARGPPPPSTFHCKPQSSRHGFIWTGTRETSLFQKVKLLVLFLHSSVFISAFTFNS